MNSQSQAYTVTAITRIIKSRLEENLKSIWVEGEISNYLHHSSGHRYFNLKDDSAVIRVTLWKSTGARLKFEPKHGQKVLAQGDITVYEKGGSYQLNCQKLVPVGVGPLELAFRQLHEKLTAEGLFDDDRKQPMPAYPRKIGIVTSPTGAAVRDIIRISRRRNSSVELVIYPAKVQGDGGEQTIAAGIEYFNSRDDIDLIITGRGGGSLEDLWNFNTELVVRAIAASRLPVISAVGHEIDRTLSDLAADLRAATPSAAAEIAVWSKSEFESDLANRIFTLASHLKSQHNDVHQQLQAILSRPVWSKPMETIRQKQQYLDSLARRLGVAGKNSFERVKNDLSSRLARLDDLSPLKVLSRGYTVTRIASDQKLVRSIKGLKKGLEVETILPDGRLISTINEIDKNRLK